MRGLYAKKQPGIVPSAAWQGRRGFAQIRAEIASLSSTA
jgi:hypothetical protein